MNKYVIFFKDTTCQIIKKDLINRELIKGMRRRGYKKHPVEVEAESEKEARVKFNDFSRDSLNVLKDFSDNWLFCTLIVVAMALLFIIRYW
ncbi:hypothetical protein [Pantoea sp. KPR_PJ]|uniref:hypothetical protein n=1 Tax=Pantoea sp. KPR_PJ TaxID=2738375 RepID=UPI003529B670